MNRIASSYVLAVSSLFLLSPLPTLAGEAFVHPGLLHSKADLDRMRVAVAEKAMPIYQGFKVLAKSPHAHADYRRRGPFSEWGRATGVADHSGEAQSDAKAAYQNALMWAITGDRSHANKSIEIINAWMGTLKRVTGIDGVLASGLQGFKFANAAELRLQVGDLSTLLWLGLGARTGFYRPHFHGAGEYLLLCCQSIRDVRRDQTTQGLWSDFFENIGISWGARKTLDTLVSGPIIGDVAVEWFLSKQPNIAENP